MMIVRLRPDEHAELTKLVQEALIQRTKCPLLRCRESSVASHRRLDLESGIVRAMNAAANPAVPVYESITGDDDDVLF